MHVPVNGLSPLTTYFYRLVASNGKTTIGLDRVSSTHKLPDLVVALHGPPSQPIEIDAAGGLTPSTAACGCASKESPTHP